MTGSRKFRFAIFGLVCLLIAFVLAAFKPLPPTLFAEFAWSIVGIVTAFGVPNVGEHVAKALAAKRGQA